MKRTLKNILIAFLLIIVATIVVIAIYASYLFLSYSRIDDKTELTIKNQTQANVKQGEEYSIVTYNVGFGCYSPEFSFFMDEADWKNGKHTVGVYGRGINKNDVIKDTLGTGDVLRSINPDFILLQEVDEKATRSFNINMRSYYEDLFSSMNSIYAVNFHSQYLNLPLYDPHGIVNAGLLTLSKYKSSKAERISYPVSSALSKIADLDRCFSIERFITDNGKELVIINNHMSAYDEGGVIRKAQLDTLNSYLETEYKKGNYVIVGGDFNHALGEEYANAFKTDQLLPEWVSILNDSDLPSGFSIVKPENGFSVPTVRSCDIPYTKGVNYLTIVDGFIVSDNIDASSYVYDTDFSYSDHQPVVLTFILKQIASYSHNRNMGHRTQECIYE